MTEFPNDRERDVRKHLKMRLKLLGGELRKVRWIMRNGAPDEFVTIPANRAGHKAARSFWIELKAPGKVPERHQQKEIDWLRAHGQTVYVCDSREAVDAVLFLA